MSDFIRREAAIIGHLSLDMSLDGEPRKKTEKIAESLSGIDRERDRTGDYLFLGADEGAGLERLAFADSGVYRGRKTFPLTSLFDLPGDADEEADIESLSIDDTWLWLVTSHARTRAKLKDDVDDFADIEFHPRRYVLGRIPLATDRGKGPIPVSQEDGRRARCVPLSDQGSALTDAVARDPHLRQSLAIPAKENGLDIEGIATRGQRIVLGLRGPVLRERAMLLDLDWLDDNDARLPLRRRDGLLYRKIFLDLNGLAVRDLCRRGKDLMILAGPTMPLPAPFRLYEIPGFFDRSDAPDIVEPDYLCDVSTTEGNPEGLSLYETDPDIFMLAIDGAEAENKVHARALLIRTP